VQAPRALPRLIRLPQTRANGAQYAFVFLSSIIHAHVDELFAGMKVLGSYQFRVTRNSDLFVDEEEIKNLHTALQGELLHRHFGTPCAWKSPTTARSTWSSSCSSSSVCRTTTCTASKGR
jgi:polyphosphate kinase